MLYAILFAIGALVVIGLLFTALGLKNVSAGGQTADLRYVGFALVLIILSALTVGSMLILGKAH
ncbi:MAG: hypothetical protein M1369_00755 [Deinococcus sp.]|nr:hypothetical protein [Deinococcus sp.]MCL5964307.1 hypothetical protein [Deinococcus sp.]